MLNFLTNDQCASLIVHDLYPSTVSSMTTDAIAIGSSCGDNYSGSYTIAAPIWQWWAQVPQWDNHYHYHYYYEELRPVLKDFSKCLSIGDSMPRIDILFDKSTKIFTIRAAICGIPKDQVKVTIDNGYIIFKFDNDGAQDENVEVIQRELSTAKFERKIKIPETADTENIQTSYEDGVMLIKMPTNKAKYKELTF